MQSYKAVLGLLVPGARVYQPQYGHYFSDEGLVWGGIFSSLFVAVDKKGLAHLLDNNYGVIEAIVCEKLLIKPIHRQPLGRLQLHRTILEFGYFPNRVERLIGEQIRGCFVVTKGNKYFTSLQCRIQACVSA